MRKIWHGMILLMFLLACSTIFYSIYRAIIVPPTNYEVVLFTHISEVRRGQDMSVSYAGFNEPNGCVIRIDRYLLPVPFTKSEFKFDSTEFTGDATPDENPKYRVFLVPIPNDVNPGEFLYYIKGVYYCDMWDYLFGGHEFHSTPIRIKVTDGNSV